MPAEKVRDILRIAQEPVSMETPIGEEEDSHLGDFIKDDNVPVPADAAAFTLLKEQLEEVLGGHILEAMNKGVWQRVLVAATGALMSPTSAQQGDSIPGICHAVAIESGV